jgi:hypothetical protein
MVEGILNQAEDIRKRHRVTEGTVKKDYFKINSQPCSFFCDDVTVIGTAYPERMSFPGFKRNKNSYSEALRSATGSLIVMKEEHKTDSLFNASASHRRAINKIVGCNVFDFTAIQPNYSFFFLREGATVVTETKIGRYYKAIPVYREQNFSIIQDLHNNVLTIKDYIDINDMITEKFGRISSWELEDFQQLYNSNTTNKNSRPPFATSVEEDYHVPTSVQAAVMQEYVEQGMAAIPKEFSWHWFILVLTSEYVPRVEKLKIWALVQNWYTRASPTVVAISNIENELMEQEFYSYEGFNYAIIDMDRHMSFATGQRDSFEVLSSSWDDSSSTSLRGKEDAQRLVARGYGAGGSLEGVKDINLFVDEKIGGRYVHDFESWLDCKYSLSGVDLKKADTLVGATLPKIGYGKASGGNVGARLKIQAPPLASGELETMSVDTRWFDDIDGPKGLDCHRLVRKGQGDDKMLRTINPEIYIELFNKRFPFDFEVISPKQTAYITRDDAEKLGGVDFKDKPNYPLRLVFNLGNTIIYDNNNNVIGIIRAQKLVKTEQSPVGSISELTDAWEWVEYNRVPFYDYWNKKFAPEWVSYSFDEFEGFYRNEYKQGTLEYLPDLPGSLVYILEN